MAIIDY